MSLSDMWRRKNKAASFIQSLKIAKTKSLFKIVLGKNSFWAFLKAVPYLQKFYPDRFLLLERVIMGLHFCSVFVEHRGAFFAFCVQDLLSPTNRQYHRVLWAPTYFIFITKSERLLNENIFWRLLPILRMSFNPELHHAEDGGFDGFAIRLGIWFFRIDAWSKCFGRFFVWQIFIAENKHIQSLSQWYGGRNVGFLLPQGEWRKYDRLREI